MNKDDIIVIFGASGFVGKSLLNRLTTEGFTNIFAPKRTDLCLFNKDDVERYFKFSKPVYVFNCAAKVGGIQANINDPYHFLYDNLVIQNNIINSCVKYETKKVINLGSSCIYPKNRELLKEEDLLTGSMEETNLGYSLAKISGLYLCKYANKQYGKRFISLMPTNVFGENDHFDLQTSHALAANVRKVVDAKLNNDSYVTLWGDGTAKREWLYIDDLINAILWSIDNLEYTENFLNVGYGSDISMLDLVKLICKIVDFTGEIKLDLTKPIGQKQKLMDSSKINTLGWRPEITLEEGIKKTIDFYVKNYKKCI